MPLTLEQARDEIGTIFKTAWATISPTPPPIAWDDVDAPNQPPAATPQAAPWCRFTLQHSPAGGQRSLGTRGNRVFERFGSVFIQVFTPHGDGYKISDELCTVAREAFEGENTPGGVFFYNVNVVEAGKSGAYRQVNVIANFRYDEIR